MRAQGVHASIVVVCIGVQIFAAAPSHAAEWSAEPSVALRTDYNDNFNFTPGSGRTVWGAILSPDIKFSGETETLKVTGGLMVNVNRYPGNDDLNTIDHTLTLRSGYRAERDLFGLNVDSIRDSTLVTELATTGTVQSRHQRSQLTANPSWTRSLTELTAITAGYNYTDVRYSDVGPATNLIDYGDQTATIGLQHRFSERDIFNVNAYYDRYQTNPGVFVARTYGIEGQLSHDFDETLRGSFALGWRKTQSSVTSHALVCSGDVLFGICFGSVTDVVSNASADSSGFTFNAALLKSLELDTVNARISREINPSGIGSLIQTDRVQATWIHHWSPALSASIDAAAYHTRYVGVPVGGANGRYYKVETRVTWQVSESWALEGGFAHARQSYEGTPLTADVNVVYAALSYVWPKLSVSR